MICASYRFDWRNSARSGHQPVKERVKEGSVQATGLIGKIVQDQVTSQEHAWLAQSKVLEHRSCQCLNH